MTELSDYSYKPCEKLDGKCVDAFAELIYNPEINGDTSIQLSSTWGDSLIDLGPIVKAGETITSLYLTPAAKPIALQYDREDGAHDCIEGDDLSHIISMKYLKDVAQETLRDGDIYKYDAQTSLFAPFNLDNYMQSVAGSISNLEQAIAGHTTQITAINGNVSDLFNQLNTLNDNIQALSQRITSLAADLTALTQRVSAIEATLTRPAGIPTDTVLAWANRNIYADSTNNGQKIHGVFVHATTTDMTDDTYYA